MKKIIIVEDNKGFRNIIKMVIEDNFSECTLIEFTSQTPALNAISSQDKDFDILLLDGDLGFGGHGRNVLNILTQEQLKKTIVCSGSDDFTLEAKEKGISVFIDKGFSGIRASKIDLYVLEILGKIDS